MSDPTKAVFLSYAREDTDAAHRIAEALRASGVEVWFDMSELRGGDAWDAKIRKQIDACALFIPIISSHTQERSKGYFRLEWKLAVDQTHLLAAGVPFVAPVVIDDTPESGALVPPEFLKVQWTRLPGALPTPQFVEQVKRLLGGPKESVTRKAEDKGQRPEASQAPKKAAIPGWMWGVAAAVVVAVGAGVVFLRKPEPPVALGPLATHSSLPATSSDKSIAVLPFTNMSEDKDASAFFADGMHEDLLTNLAYIRDLRVISRTSVTQYRNTTKTIGQIASELKVDYVLEGSVRRAGSKVRVTGQLIRAATDEHVWASNYDRDISDVFAIQAELSKAIAGALQAVLSPETKALLERRPTQNVAAYDAYLKARRLIDLGVMQDEETIISLFQQAVQLDPNFAAAWAWLGSRHAFAYFNRDRSAGRLAQAKTAIDTAVHLAPEDPDVIASLGDYYYYGHRDYARATEQYRKQAQLRPNDPSVFAKLGFIQRRLGAFPDAMANLRRAHQLDQDRGEFATDLIDTLMACRQYGEVLTAGRRYLQKHPEQLYIAANVARADYALHGTTEGLRAFARRTVAPEDRPLHLYLQLWDARMIGDWTEAIRLDREQRYFDGDTDATRWLQDIYAAATLAEAGDRLAARARATEAMNVMNAELARQPLSPYLWAGLGLGHGLMGENAEALRCAVKARELLPESVDQLTGPQIAVQCTSILAWAGEKDQAMAEIARLIGVPYGITVFERGINYGSWLPLRNDPRFQTLLNDPKNNAPLF